MQFHTSSIVPLPLLWSAHICLCNVKSEVPAVVKGRLWYRCLSTRNQAVILHFHVCLLTGIYDNNLQGLLTLVWLNVFIYDLSIPIRLLQIISTNIDYLFIAIIQKIIWIPKWKNWVHKKSAVSNCLGFFTLSNTWTSLRKKIILLDSILSWIIFVKILFNA